MELTILRNSEEIFYSTLKEMENNPKVCLLKKYRQHKGNTTFRHCRSVAESSFRMAQRLGWRVDERALARGAMLHDYHLYTRDRHKINVLRHAFGHPKTALSNAEQVFELSSKEKNIIRSHMWPLTLLSLPRSKEAVLVSLADKVCAFREMSRRNR